MQPEPVRAVDRIRFFLRETDVTARLRGDIALAAIKLDAETKELAQAKTEHAHILEAQERMQILSQAVQQQAHHQIADVVSRCLAAVFDDPYTFKIQFERKRGRTEASLLFERRGLVVDPLTASGGGAVDVAAFALRTVCLVLHRPRLSRVIVLDEPFRFVSAQYQTRVRKMLEMLCTELQVQIVFVTHNPKYITGTVIELS